MNNLKRKKSVKQEEKAPTKRFSYCLRGQKPQDQKIQKFLPHLISVGGVSNKKRKKKLLQFCCSEVKGKWLGLVFRCCLKRKREFVFEIWLDKVSTRQNRINPPKPTNEIFSKSSSDFMACLKVSTD